MSVRFRVFGFRVGRFGLGVFGSWCTAWLNNLILIRFSGLCIFVKARLRCMFCRQKASRVRNLDSFLWSTRTFNRNKPHLLEPRFIEPTLSLKLETLQGIDLTSQPSKSQSCARCHNSACLSQAQGRRSSRPTTKGCSAPSLC